ncbi:MAG TPA: NnrU family protein [Geminicoccaceae bacterium]|nr:NnrU family protein [Geminicoccus sp.]HMU48843.1 NnrU family protein [Geminicoccaceae bacterium]
MTNLIIAALFLLGTHIGISSGGLRSGLVATLGERAFMAIYSVIALLAMVWLVLAWRAAPWIELWPSGPAVRHLPFLVMPFALLLLVGGVSQPNPSAVGGPDDAPARGVLRVTRHPVMWAIALWALTHLLANGDLASVLFFGSFAALALAGMASLDRKQALRAPASWPALRATTSILPLWAIARHRQHFSAAEIGWQRVGIALVLYVALILLHPWLFGVAVLPGA